MTSTGHTDKSSQSAQRVLVIGIDGATFDVILPLVKAGRLPHLGRLMREGCWGPLCTVVPPVTAPAWSSFMTGLNPGRHGVYDFRYRRPGSYELATNNASTIDAPLLWETLSQSGKRSCIMHVPATYPPRPIDGECITGLLTPADATEFTYPPGLTDELLRAIPDYVVWPASMFHPKGRESEFLNAVAEVTDLRSRLFQFMQGRGERDFQMIVFMGADQVQHEMWHYHDPAHPCHPKDAPRGFRDAVNDCYERIDSAVGQILSEVSDDTTIFLVSDHGFGPVEHWFHINSWLLSEGLMVLKRRAMTRLKRLLFDLGVTPLSLYELALRLGMSKTVADTARNRRESTFDLLRKLFVSFDDVDWSKTVAYSVGNVGPIFLNLAGREPEGCVGPDEYEATLDRIADRLHAIVDPLTGKPLVTDLHFGRDIFTGPHASSGPDVMIFMRDFRVCAYGNTQFASNHWLTPSSRSGWHRMHGIMVASGPGIQRNGQVEGCRLLDIYPTILAVMGVPVLRDLDGRILESVVTQEILDGVQYAARSVNDYSLREGGGYSEDEEAMLAEHLKGLGYV